MYRVEVLGNDVQKYSSTSVSGGGGYVTTVNGATYGQTRAVTSTINHHVDQDLWVKDLSSGKEMHLNFQEFSFPVRQGHILTLASDGSSDKWERLINETTGDKSYANGFFNPDQKDKYFKGFKNANFWAIALVIPFVNFIAGLCALYLVLVDTPTTLDNKKINGAGINILIALFAGLVLFSASLFCATWIIGNQTSFFSKLVSAVAVFVAFPMFKKACGANFLKASEMISEKSDAIELEVERFRATFR